MVSIVTRPLRLLASSKSVARLLFKAIFGMKEGKRPTLPKEGRWKRNRNIIFPNYAWYERQ